MLNVENYQSLPATDAEVEELLLDPVWRLCNLYRILDESGNDILFTPNPPQMVLLERVFVDLESRNLVLKSRQIGFSTLIALIILDQCLFRSNIQCSIVDQSQADASKKLDKVKFAYERLDPEFRTGDLAPCSDRQVGFPNGSRIYAGMRARGGTNQILHISEWGPISANDGNRAQEIKTGALPTCHPPNGLVFNESTFQGGRGGPFFEAIEASLDPNRTPLDCRMLFVPWWRDARCSLAGNVDTISLEIRGYLDKLEAGEGVILTPEQRYWYHAKKREQKADMGQEYPSSIVEALNARIPGAIYLDEVVRAEVEGRISDDVLHREGFPCYTAWDIGAPENQRVVVFQVIGDRISYIESMTGSEDCKTASQWVARLKLRSRMAFGGHFVPHDAEVQYRASLEEAGLSMIQCLPRPIWIWDNINDALAAFSRCRFNATGCKEMIEALKSYHSRQEQDGVTIKNVPVHNWSSHSASAFAYSQQAIRLGWIVDRSAIPEAPDDHWRRGDDVIAGFTGPSHLRKVR